MQHIIGLAKDFIKKNIWILVPLLLLSVFVAYSNIKYYYLIHEGVRTVGKIESIDRIQKESKKHGDYIETIYNINLVYNGEKHILQYGSWPVEIEYGTGEKIEIFHSQKDVTNFVVKGNTQYIGALFMLNAFLGVVFLGIIVLSIVDYLRKKSDGAYNLTVGEKNNSGEPGRGDNINKQKILLNDKNFTLTFFDVVWSVVYSFGYIIVHSIFPIFLLGGATFMYILFQETAFSKSVGGIILTVIVVIFILGLVGFFMSRPILYVISLFRSKVIIQNNTLKFLHYSISNPEAFSVFGEKFKLMVDEFPFDELVSIRYLNYFRYRKSNSKTGRLIEFNYGKEKKIFIYSKYNIGTGQTKIALKWVRDNSSIPVQFKIIYRDIDEFKDLWSEV